ncbi:MAG: hypothetical protein H6672_18650 [Anaerolineaceae bacterium]|nr:hypothetical protein [Anaerolineaceae bacterium]
MDYQAYLLRVIADELGLKQAEDIARQPGMRAVYRLTIRYHDNRSFDSVATLSRYVTDLPRLEIAYQELFNHKPLTLDIEQVRFDAFAGALLKLRFDHTADQPNIPAYGVDLWMLERAAGGFAKSIILAPKLAQGIHAELVAAVQEHLPEAVKEVWR